MAVVTAFELDDAVAPCVGARQTQRRHCRFGAGVDETHHLDRGHRLNDEARHLRLELSRRAEAGTPFGRALEDLDDRRVRVAEDQGAPGEDVVDVLIPVDVPEARPLPVGDDGRFAAHRLEGAHGAVDAARQQSARRLEHLAGTVAFLRHGCPQVATDGRGRRGNADKRGSGGSRTAPTRGGAALSSRAESSSRERTTCSGARAIQMPVPSPGTPSSPVEAPGDAPAHPGSARSD